MDDARFVHHTRALYSPEWEIQPFGLEYEREYTPQPRPVLLPEMLEVAMQAARPFPYVRVDLYAHGGQVFFGELTFYPGKGVERFRPKAFDTACGGWLELPGARK